MTEFEFDTDWDAVCSGCGACSLWMRNGAVLICECGGEMIDEEMEAKADIMETKND